MLLNLKRLSLLTILFLFINLINTLALAPSIVKPASGSCYLIGDTLIWNSGSNVLSYNIYVSSNADMSSPVMTKNQTDTFFIPSDFGVDLFPGTVYYWQVWVYYDADGVYDSSEVRNFSSVQSAPPLNSPANNATCQARTLKLTWTSNPGFTFDLQVSTTNNFASTLVNQTDLTQKEATVTVPNFNTTYYWRVKSKGTPCTSDWSSPYSFTTGQTPPTPTLPANHSIGISELVTFKWNSGGSPTSFRIQASTDTTFMSPIIDDFTLVNSYETPLSYANRDIYWRVSASYPNCETEWSQMFTFRTQFVKPSQISPRRDSMCAPQTLKFEWVAVTDARAYRLQISESEDFTNPIINRGWIKDVSDTFTLPKPLTNYFWRLRAEDSLNVGIWSDTLRFTTAAYPPDRLYPLNKDTIPVTVKFVWKTVQDGAIYRIMLSEYSDFRTTLLDKRIMDTSYSYKMPTFYKTFYWKVQAEVFLCQSSWSSVWEFKTIILPSKLQSPANLSVKQPVKPKFQWTSPEGAEKYNFMLAKDINFKTIVAGKSGVPSNNFTYDKELETYTQYFWKVQAVSTLGSSAWSEIFSFTTGGLGPDNPVLLAPDNYTEGLQVLVNFLWTSAARATSYQLLLDDDEGFDQPLKTFDNITDTSYEVGNLLHAKFYYWKVIAINDIGTSSSDVWAFKTLAMAPTDTAFQISPLNNSTNVPVQVTFKWNSIDRAEIYELELNSDSQFDKDKVVYLDTNLSSTTKYLSDLPYNTEIYWRVRGKNDAGKGPWTDAWKFKSIVNSVDNEMLIDKYNASITPNPSSGEFAISFDSKGENFSFVRIFDLRGLSVAERSFNNFADGIQELRFSEKELPAGVYIVKLSIGANAVYLQLIISK